MTVTEVLDVDAFRAEARSWLRANMERRSAQAGVHVRGIDHKTVEGIVAERERQRRLHEGGYAGITWPTEYGGRGLSPEHQAAWLDEARDYVLPDFGVAGGTTFSVCGPTMIEHATPDFLRRHIPRILAGDEIWVQFFSEPEAGSDLAGIRSRAVRDGERWILNGSKIWSSGAYYADYGMCLTRTNWDVPKHRGLTWFAVATDAPGVEVRPITEINGNAEFCQEFFDDVELADTDMIGELDQGWRVAQTMLVYERGAGSGAPDAGDGRDLAPDLVALARRVGRHRDPLARQLVARAHTNDIAQKELARRIAGRLAAEGMNAGVAAYGKLATGTFDVVRARIGMQIGGTEALLWDAGDIESMTPAINYLNGRVMGIAGGTNEMQRNGIGERALGLPREPSFDTTKPFGDVVRAARHWDGRVS